MIAKPITSHKQAQLDLNQLTKTFTISLDLYQQVYARVDARHIQAIDAF